jgi:hypothetical protein
LRLRVFARNNKDYLNDIDPALRAPLQWRVIAGVHLVAKATPEKIVKNSKSYTAQFLKKELL